MWDDVLAFARRRGLTADEGSTARVFFLRGVVDGKRVGIGRSIIHLGRYVGPLLEIHAQGAPRPYALQLLAGVALPSGIERKVPTGDGPFDAAYSIIVPHDAPTEIASPLLRDPALRRAILSVREPDLHPQWSESDRGDCAFLGRTSGARLRDHETVLPLTDPTFLDEALAIVLALAGRATMTP